MTCESCLPLLKENVELRKRIEQLEQHNKNLEEHLKEIRSYIWKPQKEQQEPKKLGPPENHKPHNRPPPDTIHRKAKLSLSNCPECNSRLPKPVRTRKRYVEDIRQPEPFNTEYEIPYYWCRKCRRQVSPKPPEAIPKCRFGIKLMLLISFLRYGMLLPFNKIATLLRTFCGIKVSEGHLVDSITRFADYLGPEFDRIRQEIRETAYAHMDTTGWRVNGKNKVLWDFISERHALLLIRDTKAQGTAYQTLGRGYKGIAITDCAREYDNLGWKVQKCWVHLLRTSRKLEGSEGKMLHSILKAVHRLAVNTNIREEELLEEIGSIATIPFRDSKCVRLVKRLTRYRNEWFTFVNHGADDNNNAAERGLRQSVVMRKITGGNRSLKGVRNHEVVVSVMGTWERQGKGFFEEGYRAVMNLR